MNKIAYILRAVAESERGLGKLSALEEVVGLACEEIERLESESDRYSGLYDTAWGEFSRWKNSLSRDNRTTLEYVEMVDRLTRIIRTLITDEGWAFGDPIDGVEYDSHIV